MIKLIVFSCVIITLINCSLAVETNHPQQLRLRLKRSAAGKSLLTGLSTSTANAAAGSSSETQNTPTSGVTSGLSDFLSGINHEKIGEMIIGQMSQMLTGGGKGENGLGPIIGLLKKTATELSSSSSGNLGSLLLNGEAAKTIKQLLSPESNPGLGKIMNILKSTSESAAMGKATGISRR